MKTHNHRRPRCARLLNLTLAPGRAGSLDGPTMPVSVRCRRRDGHDGPHRFPVERRRPIP